MSTIRTVSKIKRALYYVLKPMNAREFKIEDLRMLKLLVLDMKGFRYYRTWGKWTRNSGKQSRNKVKRAN
jgi:hypothetical protein